MVGVQGWCGGMSAGRKLRLGRESRWRPGAPAQILRAGKWHMGRVTDLKMDDTASKTHSVMNVKVRYPSSGGGYRCKWTAINVPLENSMEAGVTHEIDDTLTPAQAKHIPFTKADAGAYLLTIHDQLEFGHGSPEALARASQRVACVGIQVASPVTVTKLTAAIRTHIKTHAIAESDVVETGALNVEGCDCDPDDCSCRESGVCRCDGDCNCGKPEACASGTPLDMSALAAVIGDDKWVQANIDILSE